MTPKVTVADLGATPLVEVDEFSGVMGPPGPPGPPGPAGTAEGVSYVHYQSSAAEVWTVVHPLTFQPAVTVVDSLKQEIWPGNVEYVTPNTIRLTFSAAVGGECYLS